jgi:hypothetical protein
VARHDTPETPLHSARRTGPPPSVCSVPSGYANDLPHLATGTPRGRNSRPGGAPATAPTSTMGGGRKGPHRGTFPTSIRSDPPRMALMRQGGMRPPTGQERHHHSRPDVIDPVSLREVSTCARPIHGPHHACPNPPPGPANPLARPAAPQRVCGRLQRPSSPRRTPTREPASGTALPSKPSHGAPE